MTERYHSKIELAGERLEDALSLFLRQSRYAAAITLAGAAEEVFGRACSERELWCSQTD